MWLFAVTWLAGWIQLSPSEYCWSQHPWKLQEQNSAALLSDCSTLKGVREKGTGLLKSLKTYSDENVQKKKKQAADEWHLHPQKNSGEHSNAWCVIRRRNARTEQSLDDSYSSQKWKLTKKIKKNQLEKKCSIENRDFIHTSYTKIHCFILRWSPSFIVTQTW